MKVVILAGGLGSRLSEETVVKPKPMVEIGTKPIIWHIMKYYSQFGFKEFVVALGYKAEILKEYFIRYCQLHGSISVDLAKDEVTQNGFHNEDWKVHLIDTGLNTQTGGRVKRLEKILGKEKFMLTYGDGVSDVDIDKLLKFHNKSKALATITAVHPPARFGGIDFDGDYIDKFREKSQIDVGWINGGFMVLEPEIFDLMEKDEDILEIEVLAKLAHEKKLAGYKHKGFWQCMDTLRDKVLLQNLWETNNAPWKIWE